MPILTTEERLGTVLEGRYRLEKVLGEGGMGVVFAGIDVMLQRPVAVKLLQPGIAQDPSIRVRFLREAQTAATIAHPNVVVIHTVGTTGDGAPYMVMEYLRGESLAGRLERTVRIPPVEAWKLLRPAVEALATAHTMGVVHRDLKPDNIFLSLGPSGTIAKVVDFGIAKVQGGLKVTATASIIGTPAYMSPEQAQNSPTLGPSADVWSMGVVLYETLSGQMPFEIGPSDSPFSLIVKIISEPLVPIGAPHRAPDLPHPVASVVMRALDRDLRVRYANANELLVAMDAAVEQAGARGGFDATIAMPPGKFGPVRADAHTELAYAESPSSRKAIDHAVRTDSEQTVRGHPTDGPPPVRSGLIDARSTRSLPASASDGPHKNWSVPLASAVVAACALVALGAWLSRPGGADTSSETAARAVLRPSNTLASSPLPGARNASPNAVVPSLDAGTFAPPANIEVHPPPAPGAVSSSRRAQRAEAPALRTVPASNATVVPAPVQGEALRPPASPPPPPPSRQCTRDIGNGIRVPVACN